MYYNCCCSCSFEPEIIRVGQLSDKMYSKNILNFQESTTIVNACTKKSANLLNALRIIRYPGLNSRWLNSCSARLIGLTFKQESTVQLRDPLAHTAPSEPETSIVHQGSSVSSGLTFPSLNAHYKPTFVSLTSCQVLYDGSQQQIPSMKPMPTAFLCC